MILPIVLLRVLLVTVLSLLVRGSLIIDTEAWPVHMGFRWAADIRLGSQELRVLLDTGSSYLWTLSKFMSPEAQDLLPAHSFYDANASSTWQPMSTSFEARYGNEEHGTPAIVGYERVTVGDFVSAVMPTGASNQSAGKNAPAGSAFVDGIMGMSFGARDQNGKVVYPTFMMAIQDQLPEPIFALEVHEDKVGSLDSGFANDTRYQGDLFELPVNNRTQSWWMVDNVSVGLDGKNLSSKALPLLFDTGGLGTGLPTSAAAAAYWAQVDGAVLTADGKWSYPCKASTPDLTLFLPGVNATLPGLLLNSVVWPIEDENGMCVGGVQGLDGSDYINVGKAFFLSYYTVWNQAKPSISFASYA